MTRCAMCDRDPRVMVALPAVRAVLSINGKTVRETALCRHHLAEWQRWRGLIYGEREPIAGQPERTASGTDA